MMEMGMDLVSDIPLTIDNEKNMRIRHLQNVCHLLVIQDSILLEHPNGHLINKTLCWNGFSSEPRKAAAKQMTRRNKIFISCFSDAQTGRHLKGKINGNWKAWVTSFNQKQNAFRGNSEPSYVVFKAVNIAKYQEMHSGTDHSAPKG